MAVTKKTTTKKTAAPKTGPAKPAAKSAPLIQSGRGLGALLARQNVARTPQNSEMAALSDIEPDPAQPRKTFDETTISELAVSIRVHGLLQPLIVAPAPAGSKKRYRIVAGERRYHACVKAGLTDVPVRVVRGDADTLAEIALVENLQREDLNAIETAAAIKLLIDKHGLTQEKAAERLGLKRAVIANKLRLLNLPDEVRNALIDGRLSEGHAKVLLALKKPEKLKKLTDDCIRLGWSVRDLERRVNTANSRTVLFQAPPLRPWKPEGIDALRKRLGFSIHAAASGDDNQLVLKGLTREQVQRVCDLLASGTDLIAPKSDEDAKR